MSDASGSFVGIALPVKKSRFKNRIGFKTGSLTIIGFAGFQKTNSKWICDCQCGRRVEVLWCHIKSGHTVSCGCYKESGEARVTHGCASKESRTREYNVWAGMKSRCYNPNNDRFMDYGGRGIKICDRWLNSFENFLEDMGKCREGFSIERIDNNGNYEPGNCKWATQLEQCNNQRDNVRITFNDRTQTAAQWEKERGLTRGIVSARIRNGWMPLDAVCTPVRKMTFLKSL